MSLNGNACVSVCVCQNVCGRVHEVRERLMAFWHLVCVSWNWARDLLNCTVCTLFIMQDGLIQLEPGPGPVCPLWLTLLALPCCWMNWHQAGPRMHWKRSDGPGNRDEPQPSRLLASILSPAALSLSLPWFRTHFARNLVLTSRRNPLTRRTPGLRPLSRFVCSRSVCY